MVDHRWTIDRGSARAAEAERSIARMELGRWDQVRRHLLARLVPGHRAGPLAFEPALAPGPWSTSASASVRFDVGIDVTGGIVRLDQGLIRALAVPPAEIWRAAVTNLAGQDRPPMLTVPGVPGSFAVLAGGPWTTGWLLVPDQLGRVAGSATPPGSYPSPVRGQAGPEAAVVVAPHPEVLIVGRAGPEALTDGGGGPGHSLAQATLALAARLARADGGSRLPLVPLLLARSMHEVLSRVDGFWNDVPVSEQPGRP